MTTTIQTESNPSLEECDSQTMSEKQKAEINKTN